MPVARLVLLLVAASLAFPGPSPAAAIDPFLCYATRRSPGTPKAPPVRDLVLAGRFETASVDVAPPKRLCAPAGVEGEDVVDPDTYRAARPIVESSGPPAHVRRRGLHVESRLGELFVDTLRPDALFVPATRLAGGLPRPDADHYECYRIKPGAGLARPASRRLTVTDAFAAERTFAVKTPRHLCVPVDAGGGVHARTPHLLCYRARSVPARRRPTRTPGVHVETGLGASTLDALREAALCLPAVADEGPCNGAFALCGRRYDQVAYATAHNAMSNADEGWIGPNQNHAVTRQLADGIRSLMLDTHYVGDVPYLCHELCDLGKKPLADGLAEIRAFLDEHPNEVVTIIFETYVSEADTAAAFAASGLLAYAHAQPPGQPWPTLRELVAENRRLIVLNDERGTLPWNHYVWDHAWETHFSAERPEDFSCAINRGNMANPLFILNHFLTRIFGNPDLARQVNFNPFFLERAETCRAASGRLPNFVTVDFYDLGDVLTVVRVLNGA